jgi:2-polyprenyl-3-methyl-5-hydroxy-6-metoxy-1,4-benzoquinol methylase
MIKTSEVYDANAVAHDAGATAHDANVTYIRRPRAREYYWQLLDGAVRASGHAWAGARVAELGCGTGTYTDRCLAAGVKEYTGVDLSEKMLEQARAKFPDPRAKFLQSSLEDFSASAAANYDITFSFSFLHHLPDLEMGLRNIRSLLTPGGVYVALHEVNTMRKYTLLESLDARLLMLYGTNGFYGMPFKRRFALALFMSFDDPAVHWRLSRVGVFVFKLLKRPAFGAADEGGPSKNLVDFQLNEPFSLAAKCVAAGEVKPYCYLGFPELMALGRPLNHEMLILRKNP